jgi:hypothetical protein
MDIGWQKWEKARTRLRCGDERKLSEEDARAHRACAQLLGELRRMINCRRRTHPRGFIAYQDENGWLDVHVNVHAIIGSDDTPIVNGA